MEHCVFCNKLTLHDADLCKQGTESWLTMFAQGPTRTHTSGGRTLSKSILAAAAPLPPSHLKTKTAHSHASAASVTPLTAHTAKSVAGQSCCPAERSERAGKETVVGWRLTNVFMSGHFSSCSSSPKEQQLERLMFSLHAAISPNPAH